MKHSFPVRWTSETGSTNSSVLEIAKKENLKALVLAADYQTAGRGQFGRKWVSQAGENLLFSIYFQPRIKPSQAAELTGIACAAMVDVLTEHGISCMIKPPNDILADSKKICGILTESSSHGETLEHVIVGIGLNVNSTSETLIPEAVSMRQLRGITHDRSALLDNLLNKFEKRAASHFSVQFDRLVGKD